ncbi:MAG: hypothetical protein QOJ09_1942 [Actinomycetota bacterium]|jgi:heme-degrading monooxygenase HmoA|nr:hypothetical protein [Actinomycetota bacterium]
MHVVVRNYKGSAKLIDELVSREKDVRELITGVDGFVAYHLVKTADGGVSVSVYRDKAGTEESTRRAAAYIKENLEGVAAGPPEVIEGESVITLTA